MNEVELEYLKTLTDQEVYFYFMTIGDRLADSRYYGKDVSKELAELKALEKVEWKRRKNNK